MLNQFSLYPRYIIDDYFIVLRITRFQWFMTAVEWKSAKSAAVRNPWINSTSLTGLVSCKQLLSHHRCIIAYTAYNLQGGPKKPDCFSDLITLWWLVLERRAVCQNVRNFIEKKVQNWHCNEFKYSLPNLLKSSQQVKLRYIWPEHMDFTQFTLTYSETTVIFPQS